jgi:hypothetical protein
MKSEEEVNKISETMAAWVEIAHTTVQSYVSRMI